MDEIKQQVQAQFGKTAANYAVSPIHAKAKDLQWLVAAAAPQTTDVALDIATGAGHTAIALAPHVAKVIASDLTVEMLDQARRLAAEAGLTNLAFARADAEALPWPDATFDIVTCRIAFHHFPAPAQALREMARVLKPGGRLLFIDNYAPGDDDGDTFINTLEKLRDPSHVRAHRLSEWQGFFQAAGLTFQVLQTYPSPVDFASWTGRSDTPTAVVELLRQMLLTAPAGVRETFAIAPEPLAFHLLKALALGTK